MLKGGNIKLLGLFIIFLLFSAKKIEAQQLWADVTLNKSSVYVGEPVLVSISIYTETWFTRGVDLGNLNVKGAFTNYLMPTSVSINKDGKRFAGVKMIYVIFPYDEKDIVFPALTIEVETPPVGAYKGVKRTLTTSSKKIKIKPIPSDLKKESWLVANTVKVTENWKGDKSDIKVGDVLERKITRNVSNTVAELIPPTVWDSIPGVSIYQGKSSIKNFQAQKDISAQCDETIKYLFEKEGQVTIPELVYTWYNPVAQKLYKRTLDAVTIDIKPNDDLGMLKSIRDSLQLEQLVTDSTIEKNNERIIGGLALHILIILVLGFVILFLVKKIRILYSYIKRRQEQYKQTEHYYFNQVKRAIRQGNDKTIVNAFYRWIDALELKDPTFKSLITQASPKKGETAPTLTSSKITTLTLKDIKRIRKVYLQERNIPTKNSWINPHS